jgi:hypothetical protein
MNKTLAEWANEQPMFQAFAKMRTAKYNYTLLLHIYGESWSYMSGEQSRGRLELGKPPKANECMSIKLQDGKWIDA